MKIGKLLVVGLLLLFCMSVNSYEDLTHQRLSLQAAYVASLNGAHGLTGNVHLQNPSLNGPIVQSIIAGAGKPQRGLFDKTAGEDYTYYTIKRKCPVDVKPHWGPWEPLSHFMPRGIWGAPSAIQQFYRFFQDAVFLWKHDKKGDAAKIRLSADFNRLLRSPLLTNG